MAQQDVLAVTRRALERTRAPWLSVHLGFSAELVTFQNGFWTASETLERTTLISNVIVNVKALKAAIDVPLLLENLDYNPTGAYEHVCKPEVMRTVLEATDTHFLLDLAHAQVSASRLGLAPDDYVARLPLERVRQLHVSGPRSVAGTLTDVHETLRPADYRLLERVLERTDPWAATLEYRQGADALAAQLDRLQAILSG